MRKMLPKTSLFLLLPSLFVCFNTSLAQSVFLKDFERMNSIKNPKEYWIKKDFVVKQDSSRGENIKLKMFNRSTRELIYVSINKDSEGARSVELEYFTASEEYYAKMVHNLVKLGYHQKNDNLHYDKFLSTYETQNLVLRGLLNIKDKDYYGIKYLYYAGKEISVPVPANGE